MKASPMARRRRRSMPALLRRYRSSHKVAWVRLGRFARFWGLTWKSFSRNRGLLRASALSYSTLLALIPLLAVALGITSSFLKTQGQQQIDTFISRLVVSVMPRSMLHSDFVGAFAGLGAAERKAPAVGNSKRTAADAKIKGEELTAANQRQAAIKARRELVRRIHQFIQNTRSGALGVTGSVGFEEEQKEILDQRSREMVALRLVKEVAAHFLQGTAPPHLSQLSHSAGVPTRLAQELMQTLCAARLVSKVAGSEPAYLPARRLESISCYDILLALRTSQGRHLARLPQAGSRLDEEFRRAEAAERQVAGAVSLLSLAEQSVSNEAEPGARGKKLKAGQRRVEGKPQAGGPEAMAA